ncbi:NADPH-dependent FMN reductase [Streptomyces sp. NPDC001165]|uniref:NADPH-dependent FMN reductase n=1 Tax=Streptomyces sp. NPDC001165 TaxID=3364546 RepID=UPI00368FF6EE
MGRVLHDLAPARGGLEPGCHAPPDAGPPRWGWWRGPYAHRACGTAPPAALTNAIDYLYEEWGGKPVGYVGYGIFGAVMAVQKLRAQAGPLRMADIGPQVALSLREDFVDFADFKPQEPHVAQVRGLVDELPAWAGALRPLRTASRAAV